MEVIPASLNDQQRPISNIRTRTFFILEDRLDESVYKTALDRLIRDHWRKLGARLVARAKDGLLEYHLPQTFDEDYILFEWSSTDFGHSIDKCPELSFFNRPPPTENGITLLPAMETVDEVVRPSTWPYERKDEPPNSPLLYVHMSLFADATVIALSFPHVLCDQFGVGNIMRAWLGITKGIDPPAMVGHNEDMLSGGKPYNDYPKEEICRRGYVHVRRTLEYPLVIMGFLTDLILHRTEAPHIVYFPRPFLQSLRDRYSKELTEKYGADPGLSSGDIILAILTKFSRMHDRASRNISLTQTVNLRGRIPQLLGDDRCQAFIHNAVTSGATCFRIDSSTPASEIAYISRKIINEATQPIELEKNIAVIREMVRRGQPIHVCEPFARSYGVTNWCAAWRGLDFGSDGTTSSGSSSTVDGENYGTKKMLVLGQSKELGVPGRYFTTIMSQTKEGFWCEFSAPTKAVALVKELLEKDPMLENF